MTATRCGKVYLVGAGPGDPELLTVKAWRCLQTAEVVVYDRLVGEQILEFISPTAESLFVGKTKGHHPKPQEEINRILVQQALSGKMVVRLKGGDPFIFGRGGEEALACQAANIPFEVIPGITSATGVCAYLGIPLTHRGLSQSVTLVTGHAAKDDVLPELNWPLLAQPGQTLVFYMGLHTLSKLVEQLLLNGRSAATPVAVVQDGTLSRQQAVTGTLANIEERVLTKGLKPPSLIIVGEVVALNECLRWFPEVPVNNQNPVAQKPPLFSETEHPAEFK